MLKISFASLLLLAGMAWSQPAAPALMTPADSAAGLGIRPTFVWGPDSGAVKYAIQISRDSIFDTLDVQDSTLTKTSYATPKSLAYGKTYYWRVKAADTVWGSYSAFRRFTIVSGPPAAPALIAPAADSQNVPWPVTFLWHKAFHADNYQIDIATDSAFTKLAVSVRPTDTTYSPGNRLSTGLTYWWRVESRGIYGTSKFSAKQSFTMVAGRPAPTLVTPADSAVNVSDRPVLAWNMDSLALAYRLELSLDSNFAKVIEPDSLTGAADTSAKRGLLNPLTVYYWHVRAFDSAGPGPWSARRRFTVRPLTAPGAPSLIGPADFMAFVDTFTTLSWKKADRAKTYHVQVSKRATFDSDIVVDDSLLTALSLTVDSLDTLTYYWRVSASNDSGTGQWSSTYQFTVQSPVSIKARLAAPQSLRAIARASGLDLEFSLPNAAHVDITLIELARGRTQTLLRSFEDAGFHQAHVPLTQPAGWYSIRMRSGNTVLSRRVFLP